MKWSTQVALCFLLAGCNSGRISVQQDGGPAADSELWQPVNLHEDGGPLQFPDLGPLPDTTLQPDTLPQPDSTQAPAPDAMHAPDTKVSCAISCTSGCAVGVSSQCTWDCGAVKHKVSCSGPSGCSQYSYCSCYLNGALVKQGPYSISTAAGGINGALGHVKAEFCQFP